MKKGNFGPPGPQGNPDAGFSVPPPASTPTSGDLGYFIDGISRLQNSIGRLEAKVESLEKSVDRIESKVGTVAHDVHTAKTTIIVVGVILTGVIGFAGWLITTALTLFRNYLPTQHP